MIPLSLSDAVDLVDVSIQKIWLKFSELEKVKYYNRYFNVVTGVTDYYEKDSSLTGLGEAARITENAVITGEAPVQGLVYRSPCKTRRYAGNPQEAKFERISTNGQSAGKLL